MLVHSSSECERNADKPQSLHGWQNLASPVKLSFYNVEKSFRACAELAASVQAAAGAPPNLKRLFASHNKITLLSDIPLLRGLECLQELALDSNPIMTAGHENVCASLARS